MESESLKKLKVWVGLTALVISNTVTLATAYFAYTKEEKEPTAKAAYSELSNAIERISRDNIALHKDVSNIRGYLDGMAEKERQEREFIKLTLEPNTALRSRHRYNKPAEKEPEKLDMDVSKPPPMKAKPAQYNPPNINALQMVK